MNISRSHEEPYLFQLIRKSLPYDERPDETPKQMASRSFYFLMGVAGAVAILYAVVSGTLFHP